MTTSRDDNPASNPESSGETLPATPEPPFPDTATPGPDADAPALSPSAGEPPTPPAEAASTPSLGSGESLGSEASATPGPPAHRAPPPPPDYGSVIWLALWSVCLALGVATGASVWDRIESRTAERFILLLPASETSESDREQWLESLIGKEFIASGQWLSPTSLVQRVSTSVPADLWAELFSEDDAWLPWLLQLQPADPLHSGAALQATLEAFRDDPRFRLVLYDQDALNRDAALYRSVRNGTFLYAGVMFALGLLALLLSTGFTRYPIEAPVGGLLAVILAAAAGYALQRFGAPLDRNPYLRSLATAFGLAALVGPMLKGRLTQVMRRRGG